MNADLGSRETKELRLDVAGAVVALRYEHGSFDVDWFRPFVTTSEPDVVACVRQGELPLLSKTARALCNTGEKGWHFLRENGQCTGVLCDGGSPGPAGAVLLSERVGTPFLSMFLAALPADGIVKLNKQFVMPLILALAERRGLLLHASGVTSGDVGVLFSGLSGVGKTTIARLWQESGAGEILNDDVCAIRKCGGQYRAYGTPWTGSGKIASAGNAPLRGLFFLEHGVNNQLVRLDPVQSLARLASQAFLPKWDAERVQHVVDLCADLVAQVPCYRLIFRPGRKVIDLLLSHLARDR